MAGLKPSDLPPLSEAARQAMEQTGDRGTLPRSAPDGQSGLTRAGESAMEQDQAREIYVRAGEIITCEAGHEVARARCDMPVNAVPRFADFEWVIPGPGRGAAPCPCGQRFMTSNMTGGLIFHFASGWRTRNPRTRELLALRGHEIEPLADAA